MKRWPRQTLRTCTGGQIRFKSKSVIGHSFEERKEKEPLVLRSCGLPMATQVAPEPEASLSHCPSPDGDEQLLIHKSQ